MYSKNFNKFCKQRNISESSRTGYFSTLKKYEKFNKLSIDQLIDEAINEEKQEIPLKERKIKRRLLNYRTYLLNSKLSQNTVRSYFVKIKTFYQHFEIEISAFHDALEQVSDEVVSSRCQEYICEQERESRQ